MTVMRTKKPWTHEAATGRLGATIDRETKGRSHGQRAAIGHFLRQQAHFLIAEEKLTRRSNVQHEDAEERF
jgi:hypothetical protein